MGRDSPQEHAHNNAGSGGAIIKPDDVVIADLLDIPIYSGTSNAPNSCFFYDSNASEWKYKDSGGTVQTSQKQNLTDSGTDTDSGDDYVLPNAADNIDLQSDGEILNAQAVTTDGATINGKEAGGIGDSSALSATLGGGWTTEDADRPVIVEIQVLVETDGTNLGQIQLLVDDSGGTTADRTYRATADPALGSGGGDRETLTTNIPPGAQINVSNASDPNNGNILQSAKKVVM